MTRGGSWLGLAAGCAAWLAVAATASAADVPGSWADAFPETNFDKHAVAYDTIISGGVPKDGIPSIDEPTFEPVDKRADWLAPKEPVIGLSVDGDARAYPLRIMTYHEIVNDRIGGKPVAVTYCPLCNTAIAFEATFEGQRLTFGTTGKLRYSDLVMYDRQTGTWWQQFTGRGIVGEHSGKKLEMLPARLMAWQDFREQHPDGRVLVPTNPHARPYGRNPYAGYDSSKKPFLYDGELPEKVPAMARVAAVGDQAWSFELLREKGTIERGDLVISWEPGQRSALDAREVSKGREVGSVVAQRRQDDGTMKDVPVHVTFGFAFHAFHPEGTIHVLEDAG
ncbi:Protein of unknown function [Limimonas halophila]|uniref:DUF3179 domain-containing protein n=1 Tax=Limimonas halophila TaxID=1082479 RepID=A0A1G7S9C4_9PROT|nr:DUF3179 domain-containing protein [Limimonas halophila]SDG19522.1 Protein of unknown function [Limimonas halophila]